MLTKYTEKIVHRFGFIYKIIQRGTANRIEKMEYVSQNYIRC